MISVFGWPDPNTAFDQSEHALFYNILYQSSKSSFSCVSLVESVSREIEEIKLSPSHQRERETMHYSPVNKKKNDVRHHMNTRPLDSQKLRMFCKLKLDLFYRIKFKVF